MQYLPDGDVNIYKFHCPKKEPDRQATALCGKINNVQGKNSCVCHLLVLSSPV